MRDNVFRVLTFNMMLVLIGYAMGTTQGQAVTEMTIFKGVVLFFSFLYVLYKNTISTQFIKNIGAIYFIIVSVFVLSFLSEDPFKSIYRGLTFVYPLLYIIYSINYLLRYGAANLMIALSCSILLVYSIVPISFFLVGGSLIETYNIYGYQEGNYFVSNHYGWGSTMFILCAFSVLRFYPLKFFYKLVIYIFLPFVFYLLIISANRAGLLSVFIAFILFIKKDQFVGYYTKLLIILSVVLIILFVALQKDSAIDFLLEKNENQIESGTEGRLIGTAAMLKSFERNPVYWLIGVGMFNYDELHLNGGILRSYHNSYWEILFGSGIIVFFIFLSFMVFHPLKIFWKTTLTYSLLIIPLIIIPLFEGNLTAGQFLFFPWFSYMILMNAKEFDFVRQQKKLNSNT
ncbi:O-antigen ligase family protein [Flavobacteriaceae bacterium F08102]|nr:O-antigen ligase family protein [Flavobacteriaceae bacterium F08102]